MVWFLVFSSGFRPSFCPPFKRTFVVHIQMYICKYICMYFGCPASCAKINWPTDQNRCRLLFHFPFVCGQSRVKSNWKGQKPLGGGEKSMTQTEASTSISHRPMSQLANCEPFNCHPQRSMENHSRPLAQNATPTTPAKCALRKNLYMITWVFYS